MPSHLDLLCRVLVFRQHSMFDSPPGWGEGAISQFVDFEIYWILMGIRTLSTINVEELMARGKYLRHS
jgi:hypothetical protein